jgi:hypothetical protein
MKNWILGLAALALTLPANAQELPQPSPTSTVDQRIGLTDFSITYSVPRHAAVPFSAISFLTIKYGVQVRTDVLFLTLLQISQ